MKRLALAFLLCASPALGADKPSTLHELFAPLSQGGCVRMDDVRAVGATATLTPEQFEFVRAFYMAVPPVSHELLPGSKAFLVKGPDATVAGLYDDDGAVCAVFEATDWLERLIDEVGRGATGRRGDPL
jgi:hypothetical protein